MIFRLVKPEIKEGIRETTLRLSEPKMLLGEGGRDLSEVTIENLVGL